MTEEFLHFIWRNRLFQQSGFVTETGEEVQILKTGEHNTHAGPDFFNARIKIGKTTWAGNVEMHLRASDWSRHKHMQDKAYGNIILHVVLEQDEPIFRKDGKVIPSISLKNKFDSELYKKYQQLIENSNWIPCAKQVSSVDAFTVNSWLDRMLVERLESKAEEITSSLEKNKNNWEETFYHRLARNFGFKNNAVPFELLAKSLPFSVLAKHKQNVFQLEAMLFGQAGMLEKKFKDAYPNELKKEFDFLSRKFSLTPIPAHLWKFLRMRPVSFPTIRVAQFAQLIYTSSHLFSKIIDAENISSLEKLFDANVSEYWQSHFVFDKPSASSNKKLGKDSMHNIIINTVVPFLFVYGIKKKDESSKEKALRLLAELPPENNSIIRNWYDIGIKSENSFQTQALYFLKSEYCSHQKCLTCGIGNKLLRSEI